MQSFELTIKCTMAKQNPHGLEQVDNCHRLTTRYHKHLLEDEAAHLNTYETHIRSTKFGY